MERYRASEASATHARQDLEAQLDDHKAASGQAAKQAEELSRLRSQAADLQARLQVHAPAGPVSYGLALLQALPLTAC